MHYEKRAEKGMLNGFGSGGDQQDGKGSGEKRLLRCYIQSWGDGKLSLPPLSGSSRSCRGWLFMSVSIGCGPVNHDKLVHLRYAQRFIGLSWLGPWHYATRACLSSNHLAYRDGIAHLRLRGRSEIKTVSPHLMILYTFIFVAVS